MAHVLIVDDEPEYLDELVEALSFRGLSTYSVGRGAEALDLLAREPGIRVVLTDMRMPDMDGVALVEAVHGRFPGRDLRFLMMTGHAADADMERARQKGVLRCFPKPLAFDLLCDALVELGGVADART
ncbi:response regulator [Xanthobacter sp.]|uniref:response regulator n=1 Tax=Xanthobacter sp. TaxID=35809 RepID=UPI0025CC7511|nr:response regulator [Xanthobacter sp.]